MVFWDGMETRSMPSVWDIVQKTESLLYKSKLGLHETRLFMCHSLDDRAWAEHYIHELENQSNVGK